MGAEWRVPGGRATVPGFPQSPPHPALSHVTVTSVGPCTQKSHTANNKIKEPPQHSPKETAKSTKTNQSQKTQTCAHAAQIEERRVGKDVRNISRPLVRRVHCTHVQVLPLRTESEASRGPAGRGRQVPGEPEHSPPELAQAPSSTHSNLHSNAHRGKPEHARRAHQTPYASYRGSLLRMK